MTARPAAQLTGLRPKVLQHFGAHDRDVEVGH